MYLLSILDIVIGLSFIEWNNPVFWIFNVLSVLVGMCYYDIKMSVFNIDTPEKDVLVHKIHRKLLYIKYKVCKPMEY